MTRKFLVRHIGNMGDMVFIVPPVLAALKKQYPDCHITFVTSWGFKEKRNAFAAKLSELTSLRAARGTAEQRIEAYDPNTSRSSAGPNEEMRQTGEFWGRRNQGGHSLHLMMTNPHIDQLVHWHDTKVSLDAKICIEDGTAYPTWSRGYYQQQAASGNYERVIELDFGIKADDDPIKRALALAGLSDMGNTDYKLYLTARDQRIADEVMQDVPRPRIALLESLSGPTTRSWDPDKVRQLASGIKQQYSVPPIWFGSKHVPYYQGRPLTLRENIATLTLCDIGIGVLSGPLHFAAAVGLPTLTLYCDHPIQRAAPAYFLNPYRQGEPKHRTLLGPTNSPMQLLKSDQPSRSLTSAEQEAQGFKDWSHPGKQSTKSCLSVITVSEVMTVLNDMIHDRSKNPR